MVAFIFIVALLFLEPCHSRLESLINGGSIKVMDTLAPSVCSLGASLLSYCSPVLAALLSGLLGLSNFCSTTHGAIVSSFHQESATLAVPSLDALQLAKDIGIQNTSGLNAMLQHPEPILMHPSWSALREAPYIGLLAPSTFDSAISFVPNPVSHDMATSTNSEIGGLPDCVHWNRTACYRPQNDLPDQLFLNLPTSNNLISRLKAVTYRRSFWLGLGGVTVVSLGGFYLHKV